MLYWRERDKAVMLEPDSDDDDSTYAMVKKMWMEVPLRPFHFIVEGQVCSIALCAPSR